MAHLAIGVFFGIFALLLAFGLFCAAIAIATSNLEEHEHEPEPTAPHRPIW